ncbi:hypothetical protein Tco_0930594, partial [Tanacetum coccineum]
MLDTQEMGYTVDMFHATLKLQVETPDNPFIAPVTIKRIESFMHQVFNRCLTIRTSGHDETKINILQLFHAVVNRVNVYYAAFLCIHPFLQEQYHSIKDDIPLISVYSTGDVNIQGMLIPDTFLTEEIRATDDYNEYETVVVNVVVLMNQPQPVIYTQGTHKNTLSALKTPTLNAASPQKKIKQVGESSTLRKSLKG